jgi:hypothetical protein
MDVVNLSPRHMARKSAAICNPGFRVSPFMATDNMVSPAGFEPATYWLKIGLIEDSVAFQDYAIALEIVRKCLFLVDSKAVLQDWLNGSSNDRARCARNYEVLPR